MLDAAWPLTPERLSLIARLAELVRKAGAGRFVAARIVRADASDFPDAWTPTATAVHGLIHRLCWHGYFDPEVTVDDLRGPSLPTTKMLKASEVALTLARDNVAAFQIDSLGNDDVAGLLASEVGRAFLELAPSTPFRDAAVADVTAADASLAAIYLGLGVLVANAAWYRRFAQRWEVQRIRTEEQIEEVGGLSVGDAVLVLAIQDLLRDEVQDALATLHPLQQEWLAAWRAVLEPHEPELRAMLELEPDCDVSLPPRSAAPRPAPVHAEHQRTQQNAGRITFRVRRPKRGLTGLGLGTGAAAAYLLAAAWIAPVLVIAGGALGFAVAGKRYECSEPECREAMATELPTCPRCGGTIAETIAHPSLRLERREALERIER